MVLFDFCSCHWLLPWILPFLLGLALGWLLWARYKAMVADLEGRLKDMENKLHACEGELSECRSRRADVEGDLAICRGRVREMELAIKSTGTTPTSKPVIAQSLVTPVVPLEAKLKPKPKATAFAGLKNDNLQIVEGIGPKMDSVLKENGVHTWADLASKNETDLRAILGKYGDKYRIIDPKSWAIQAAHARDGKWDELISLQKQLDAGRGNTGNTQTDSKLEKLMVKLGLMKKYAMNDLKAVEGIGPKIEGLLNKAGINTWRELANTSVERIQGILDDAGSRYKLADPSTWPKQSGMAADGKWDELNEYQDFLQGGKG